MQNQTLLDFPAYLGESQLLFYLNGDDWSLTGWSKHQWKLNKPVETSAFSSPAVMPLRAEVPGSVQTDLLRAGVIEDWNEGLNFFNLEWVEHREWTYEKRFVMPAQNPSGRYFLCFEGLDFSGYVFLNGRQVLYFDQMHLQYETDVTDLLFLENENHLKVVFLQPPEVDGQIGYTSRTTILKSRFNYGWDWTPRLVNIGIFGDVYIRCAGAAHFKDVYPKTSVCGRNGLIDVKTDIGCLSCCQIKLHYTVRLDGELCAFTSRTQALREGEVCSLHTFLEVSNARLWYTNGAGRQPLYTVDIRAFDENGVLLDFCEKTVGFRQLKYIKPRGAPRDSIPYSLELNGKHLPIKGVNWVPISPFYGSVTEDDYSYYLLQLRQMNVNLLRVWGGALLESETFYRLCDRMGFLVWQEFPQSSSGIDNAPCEDKDFIRLLVSVAECYVIRRRHHVCIAFWCAGNELYNEKYIPVTSESPNIAALEKVVKTLDSDRLFLPGSPSGRSAKWEKKRTGGGYHGDTHGPWTYLGVKDHYFQFDTDDSLLHSEVGAPGCAREETLKRYCKNNLWPPTADNPFWLNRGSWWIYYNELESMFGSFDGITKGIPEYVKAFRYIQMEALRYSAAAIRRSGRKKAGMIVWMANEPFPNSANTSILECDGCPKPAFYKLQNAFDKVMLGLSYASPALRGQSNVDVSLFACSDGPTKLNDICITVYDIYGNQLESVHIGQKLVDVAEELASLTLPVAAPLVLVRVTAKAKRELCEEYVFTADADTPFGPLLDMPKTPVLVCRRSKNRFILTNTSGVTALFIDCTGIGNDGRPLVVHGSYRCLLPKESAEVYTLYPCASLNAEAINSSCASDSVILRTSDKYEEAL